MQKQNDELLIFDKYFWTFVRLIIDYPKIYLNDKGFILFKMAENFGRCESFSRAGKWIERPKVTATKLCRELEVDNRHIYIIRESNRKCLMFNEKIVSKSIRIPSEAIE